MNEGKSRFRKVQLTGRTTLIVSLPKDWARRYGIKPGTYLEVITEADGSLRLLPVQAERRKLKSKLRIESSLEPSSCVRLIIAKYLAGFREIEISFCNECHEQRRAIRRFLRNLLGMEIIEESKERMLIQCLMNEKELPMRSAIRRLSILSRSMVSDSLAVLEERDPRLSEEVIERDDDVDKLYFFVVRQANLTLSGELLPREIGIERVRELLYYTMAARILERISDHAVRICENSIKLSESPRDLLDLGRESKEVFDASVRILGRERIGGLEEIPEEVFKRVEQIRRRASELIALYSIGEALIIDSLRRIAEYSSDLVENWIDTYLGERDLG